MSNLLAKATSSALPFGAAALLVLWGAVGQLAIAALLVAELHQAGALAASSQWLLLLLILAMIVAVLTHVFHAVARPDERATDNAPADPTAQAQSARGWSIP